MYDVAIIGAGPAGIQAAKASLKYGLKTALIEKKLIGGVCLNRGCIPMKFFINKAETIKNFNLLSKEKSRLIEKIRKGLINFLEDKGIDIFYQQAELSDLNKVKLEDKTLEAQNIILATGSSPRRLEVSGKESFLDCEELLERQDLPLRVLIVGAGPSGVESSFLLNSLNSKVTLIEKEERILPFLDEDISERIERFLLSKGIEIKTSTDFLECDLSKFDRVILATGRVPNTSDLGLEEVGISLNENKGVKVDSFLRTNVNNIYACGDILGRNFYAYTADYEGRVAIENIIGLKNSVNYRGLARCIFIRPQLSWTGEKEIELKRKGLEFKVIKSSLRGLSSSYVYSDEEGFVKVILDKKDNILGAVIFSKFSAEIIHLFSLAIINNLNLSSLKKLIPLHPSISEFITQLL